MHTSVRPTTRTDTLTCSCIIIIRGLEIAVTCMTSSSRAAAVMSARMDKRSQNESQLYVRFLVYFRFIFSIFGF